MTNHFFSVYIYILYAFLGSMHFLGNRKLNFRHYPSSITKLSSSITKLSSSITRLPLLYNQAILLYYQAIPPL